MAKQLSALLSENGRKVVMSRHINQIDQNRLCLNEIGFPDEPHDPSPS